jgi:hypothetical protein
MNKKSVEIIGGGTVFHVRSHLALSAPAYGTTARLLEKLCLEHSDKLEVNLHLTKMANAGFGDLDTPDNIRNLVDRLIENPKTKIIFFNAAMVDYGGVIQWKYENGVISDTASGKYQPRLKTAEGLQQIKMFPLEKIISRIRSKRKDIFLVGFKTTCGEKMDARYIAGLRLLKQTSCNLVFVNDIKYRKQMVITPEESYYYADVTREEALKGLVEMAYLRSHLTFTRSTVVDAAPVPWESPEVPEALRQVVDYCIEKKAYKPFLGATVGHFACKLNDTEFLTSRRKTNFNDLNTLGLVRIKTDGPDSVVAYGSKPSVGGQSQRIVFSEHPEYDCIVHFHCPIMKGSDVPIVSQREYECGSHECGQNTSRGLKKFGNLSAVMLDNHGPNIVFHHSIDPKEVIAFIETNFFLDRKTGGPVYG